MTRRSVHKMFLTRTSAGMILVFSWLALLGTSSMVGCAAPSLTTPSGFVELEEDEQFYTPDAVYKAVSADGAVLMVREHDNQAHAETGFWVDALTREMTLGQGYELIGTNDVSLQSGLKGKRVELRGTMNEIVYRYEVSVFATEDSVITAEASAPEEIWADHEQTLRSAVATLEVE